MDSTAVSRAFSIPLKYTVLGSMESSNIQCLSDIFSHPTQLNYCRHRKSQQAPADREADNNIEQQSRRPDS